jgi:hypothetical protein
MQATGPWNKTVYQNYSVCTTRLCLITRTVTQNNASSGTRSIYTVSTFPYSLTEQHNVSEALPLTAGATYLSNPGSIRLACPMINTDDEPTSQKKVDSGAANQRRGMPKERRGQ